MKRIALAAFAADLSILAAVVVSSVANSASSGDTQNFCKNGVDSDTCVSCIDKNCSLGGATADNRSGVIDVRVPAKQLHIEMTAANMLLSIEYDGAVRRCI
jgi:hypothetical protein